MRLVTRLSTIGLLCIAACGKVVRTPEPPLVIPFEAQRAGARVTQQFRIVKKKSYLFYLRLRVKDQTERRRLWALMGGQRHEKTGPAGEVVLPIPLHFRVEAVSPNASAVLFDLDVSDLALLSWSSDSLSKLIAEIPLEPGNYRVVVESFADIPELTGTPISFEIGSYPQG